MSSVCLMSDCHSLHCSSQGWRKELTVVVPNRHVSVFVPSDTFDIGCTVPLRLATCTDEEPVSERIITLVQYVF